MKPLTIAEDHVLLLKAGLSDAPVCFEAWERWRKLKAGQPHDDVSARLYPLVYGSLTAKGRSDPSLEALKPWYQQSRAKNQVILGLLPRMQKLFEAAGIPWMLLKGAAMIATQYADPAVRPLGDLDVLVTEDAFPRAFKVLEAEGWMPFAQATRLRVLDTRFTHAVQFLKPGGLSIDLHCYVLSELAAPRSDEGMWRRARAVEIGGVRAECPAVEDLLLVVCVHGIRRRADVDLRWVADGVTLGSDVTWDVVAERAIAAGMGGLVGRAVAMLQETFGVPVPRPALERMERAGVDPRVMLVHEALELGPQRPLAKLRAHWAQLELGTGGGLSARLAAIPAYLRFWCQVESLGAVPSMILRKTARRIGYHLGMYDYHREMKAFLKQGAKAPAKVE